MHKEISIEKPTEQLEVKNFNSNKILAKNLPVHDWYRFVLSYPPHLVDEYIKRFNLDHSQTLLDPFCGTGTTIVEAKLQNIPSIGIEAHPMSYFASEVKTIWNIDPDGLLEHANKISELVKKKLVDESIDDDFFFDADDHKTIVFRTLPQEKLKLLLTNSISPRPMLKTLTLLEILEENRNGKYHRHELLALSKALVYSISNLKFGPEVGIGKLKEDVPVIRAWLSEVKKISDDLRSLKNVAETSSSVYHADSRDVSQFLKPQSIDAVITSPPYPNEKDYTRTSRLESVLLGFINNKDELRALKKNLLRSNTRGVYKQDDDDLWVAEHKEIHHIAEQIEIRRLALGKTSGFERLYPRVTKLYFGGMAKHFANLRKVLKPGAQLAYVVGDQASYLRVMIQTGKLLASIAQSLGYELLDIDLFRTRLATATKVQLREEVILLRWPG